MGYSEASLCVSLSNSLEGNPRDERYVEAAAYLSLVRDATTST